MKRRGIVAALTRRRISTKPSADSLILLQLGNEWDGLALDFTSNLQLMRISTGAERLLAAGPSSVETAIGMDFTDNTYAIGA